MFTLLKKEVNGFLNSLIGYVVMVVFLGMTGLFLWIFPLEFNLLDFGYANLDGLFLLAPFVFLFLIPAITMRSFAEERRSGTLELLMTQPLTDLQVIVAKYFAGLLLVVFALIPTGIWFISVWLLGLPPGNLDTGSIWGSYTGLLFLGASFVAIGIFISSLTDNQIVSFILTVFVSFLLYMGFELVYTFVLSGKTGLLIQSLGLNAHYSSMSRGVIDTRDMIYFLSVIVLFLMLTKASLESRMRRPVRSLTALGATLVIILLVNIIASFLFTRVDLTAEKRYSIAPATKRLLKNLDDIVYFKVYLQGDLPPGFQQLADETREMLDEFRAYSDNIEFSFVNPSDSPNAKERNDAYKLLAERGLQPTNLRVNTKGESKQLIIFPGAIVSYKGREVPVQLLMTQIGQDPEMVLNTSVQGLEYNLASSIQKLTTSIKPRVAILEGNGELDRAGSVEMESALKEFYNVDRVTLGGRINSLALRIRADSLHDELINKYRAIVIAKPTKPFNERDKFLIDQFIMRGGRVLWLVDPVFASMDSLEKYTSSMGIAQDLNLEDLLFNYGIRGNTNLVMDLSSLAIPVKTGQVGDQPQFEFFPWYFFPVLTPMISHPIVNGLNAIKTEFISSVDTVNVPGVRKTFLLTSSPYSRTVNAPALIDLEILRDEPDQRMFRQGPQPVAVLLEGTFPSAYLFRIPPDLAANPDMGVLESSKPTRMILIADGDIFKNQFHFSQGYSLPLGYDQYTRQTFGNRELLLNAMNYLCDDSGLITVRSRELKLRLLDSSRIAQERLFWQLLNTLAPVLLIVLFGLLKHQLRRRKYTR